MRYTHLTLLAILFAKSLAIGQWTEIVPTITPVFLNSSIAYNGKVYFTGGPKTKFVTVASYEDKLRILDLATNSITTANGGLIAGRCGIACAAYNNKLYFAGGFKYTSTGAGAQVFNVVDVYDIPNNSWSTLQLSVARGYAAAAVVDGKIIFAGGVTIVNNQQVATKVVDILDPGSGNWTPAQLSIPRADFPAAVTGDTVWFYSGVTDWNNYTCTTRMDIYVASQNQWSTMETPQGREGGALAVVGNKLLFAGGFFGGNGTQGKTDRVDIFNIPNGPWEQATLSSPRSALSAATVGQKAYFIGGGNYNLLNGFLSTSTDIVDIYDADMNEWSIGHLNTNRTAHTCSVSGNTIVVGGGWRAEQDQTTGSVEILTDPSTSIPSIPRTDAVDLEIFPNPTSTPLTIKFENLPASGEYATISILDAYGKVWRQPGQIITAPQTTLETGDLEQGLYFLSITFASGKTTVRPFTIIK